jgi:1,4-alpha-glucan branching enzyme
MPLGYLTLVLHAHLPYVRHPEFDDFLEEDWLYEAIIETYIPLLHIFEDLQRDQVDWRLTMSISPTLAGMLSDPLLQSRFLGYLDNLIALTDKELQRTRWEPSVHRVAEMYMNRFTRARELFVQTYQQNLLTGFKRFFDAGKLELITCCATHAFLPLMNHNRNAIRVQIEVGASEFARHFGRSPQGIWLPECGYIHGIDELLAQSGIRYFFLDAHGVLHSDPQPRFGVYAPIICPQSGIAALGRDTDSSKQVWSAVEGYPGDYHYREFYRDIGFDLDWEYLKPHMHSLGIRHFTGIKYHKITGPGTHKEPYDPDAALERASVHAGNFMFNREKQVEWLSGALDGRPALVVAPYDAELFGHWWYEGPDWLNYLIRRIFYDQQIIQLLTIPEYLDRHPHLQRCQPEFSSWGLNGYCEVWLNETNDWIYPHLHYIADRMVELAKTYVEPTPLQHRLLNQAARELLLAQGSDWAFMMKSGTTVGYATNRTETHILNFNHLCDQLQNDKIDESWLTELERRHNPFPEIDYRRYR